MAGPAYAQTDVGISFAGIVSMQPINEEWVGSPYLDEGIGGQAPGFAAGVSVLTDNGFAVIGEVSTTRAFEQFQRGRLVNGIRSPFSNEASATARLRDTLISGLVGYAASSDADRVIFAGGISGVMTTLTHDGVSVDDPDFVYGLEGGRRYALTGAVDYLRRLSPRAWLLIGARYSRLGRSENGDQTGAGEHILRIGAGVRIGLGQ